MRLLRLAIILTSMLLPIYLLAQDNILEVNVIGTTNVDQQLVKTTAGIDVGRPLDPEKSAKAVKTLYQLGMFNDVRLETRALGTGEALDIIVSEYPIIDGIDYEGNESLSNDKLDDITSLRKGSFWSPFLAAETTAKIKQELSDKAYHAATVEYNTITLPGNRVHLEVKIEQGRKLRIRAINFNGDDQMGDKKLLKKMKTTAAGFFHSGKYDKKQVEDDIKAIGDFYQREGYLDSRILDWEIKQTDDRSLALNINIFEGKQYYFGKVTVKGNTRYTDDAILEKFHFENNALFNMEDFDKQMQAVSSMYYEEGYIYARFDQNLVKEGDRVNVELGVTENNRARVREITITGNRRTKEKIIRRQLKIAPGDYFQQSKVIQTQQSIYNLGFFEADMVPDYEPINSDGDIDLSIKLNDKMSGVANGGVGYNTEDGMVGQLALSHNNLFGNAWSTSLKWEFSGSIQNVQLDFSDPYFRDTNTLVGGNLYYTQKTWDSFNYDIYTRGAGLRVGRPINFLNYARFYVGYSLYAKKYNIIDYSDYYSDNLAELDTLGWQWNSTMSFTLSRDSRDNVFFPTSGSQFTLYAEVAGGPFGGDFDYMKQIVQVNWYTRLWWKLALRNKWRACFAEAYGRTGEVPPDERFYLGGTGSDGVRGYTDNSIGPDDGGIRSVLYSTELAVPMAGDQITGLVFFDAGNCFDSMEEFSFWDFKKGGGLGIRVQSPLGLIGFDYAYNFDEDHWEPHFQFGTTF